jgi:hypothetical protein
MEIVLAIFLIIGAIIFGGWVIRTMLISSCPTCEGDYTPFPVIPGLRWWCPNCETTYKTSELRRNTGDTKE